MFNPAPGSAFASIGSALPETLEVADGPKGRGFDVGKLKFKNGIGRSWWHRRTAAQRKSRAARQIYSTSSHEHHPADERIKKADGVHGQRFAGRHEDIRQKTGGGARAPAAAHDDTASPKDETHFP